MLESIPSRLNTARIIPRWVGAQRCTVSSPWVIAARARAAFRERRKQLPGEEQRGWDLAGALRVDRRLVHVGRADLLGVRIQTFDGGSQAGEDLEHLGDVSDAWQVPQVHGLTRE